MKERNIAAIIILVLVAIGPLYILAIRSNKHGNTATTPATIPNKANTLAIDLSKAFKANIYINGKLVARDDPPAKNFYLMLVAALAGQPITMTKITGEQQSFFPEFNKNPPQPAIAYGDGSVDDPTTAITLGDIKGTTTDCGTVWSYNQDNHIFNVTIACYAGYTGNITEVGLLLNDFLIFYTHLDTPVEVSGNTTISYNLVIPVKTGNIYIPGLAAWITWAITHDSNGFARFWELHGSCCFYYFEDSYPGYILDTSSIYYAFKIDTANKPNNCITPHYRIGERYAYIDVVLCSGNAAQYAGIVLYYKVGYKSGYGKEYVSIAMLALPSSPITWSGPNDTLFVTITVRW